MANNGASGSERTFSLSGYCIEVDRQVELQTNQGLRLYLAVIGEDGSKVYGAHVYTCLVGMLVLKPKKVIDSHITAKVTMENNPTTIH